MTAAPSPLDRAPGAHAAPSSPALRLQRSACGRSPRPSGSLAAAAMFLTTLSFLLTTPEVGDAAGFLLKDLTLLGAALYTGGEALDAAPR